MLLKKRKKKLKKTATTTKVKQSDKFQFQKLPEIFFMGKIFTTKPSISHLSPASIYPMK